LHFQIPPDLVKLLFKKWQSYTNLHAFALENPMIIEGLICGAIATAALKRFLAHMTQLLTEVPMSTRKVHNQLSRHPAVQIQQQLGLRVPVVSLQDCLAPTIAHSLRLCRMFEQPLDGFGESRRLTWFDQDATLRFFHDFAGPTEVSGHNRQAGEHIFEQLDRLGVYIIGHRKKR
jgi:hypothetical protein